MIGCAHDGKFDVEKKTIYYFTNDTKNHATLRSDFIVALAADRSNPNIMWVGTSEGLNQLDKRTGQVIRYMHDEANPASLSHEHITDIHEDKAGRLWIATWGGGLALLDRKTGAFTAYRAKQGLASDVVYGVLEDTTGALWLPTDNGLTRFDPNTTSFTNYGAGDGLQDDEFGQGTFHQGASGLFYVGGPRGFNVFKPENVKADVYVPPVVLTKLEILGQSKPIPGEISLSFRDRWFSVEFSALSYAAPERNRYRYRLAGFHDWIETDRRFVSYSSLPPGDYTLEVLGSNSHGVWNTQGLRLPLHVAPPPWRTWWAYTAYGVLALLIGAIFFVRQRSQLEALRRTHRLSELEREIALTSAIQEGFLPPERSLRDGDLSLEGFYRPAAECGGDWWSYEARPSSYLVVVGDATGHGAGSAMVTAAAAACFRSLAGIVDDDKRMQSMNEEVLRVSRGQYHMTLTAVDINTQTGRFEIQSAGGVPVFSMRPGERPKVMMCPGTPLGSPDFEMGRLSGQLVPGERMLILTDGIPEVALANAQLLGPRGVANFYMQTRTEELDAALQLLISKVEEVQTGAQDDDWTVVMVQWGTEIAVDRAA
jgi:serine phosphatase RsbU (regulator of sigma subunit)